MPAGCESSIYIVDDGNDQADNCSDDSRTAAKTDIPATPAATPATAHVTRRRPQSDKPCTGTGRSRQWGNGQDSGSGLAHRQVCCCIVAVPTAIRLCEVGWTALARPEGASGLAHRQFGGVASQALPAEQYDVEQSTGQRWLGPLAASGLAHRHFGRVASQAVPAEHFDFEQSAGQHCWLGLTGNRAIWRVMRGSWMSWLQ